MGGWWLFSYWLLGLIGSVSSSSSSSTTTNRRAKESEGEALQQLRHELEAAGSAALEGAQARHSAALEEQHAQLQRYLRFS